MKKLILAIVMMAAAASVNALTTLGTGDDDCLDNGFLVDDSYSWNGDSYVYCELPADIAVGDAVELLVENDDGYKILWVLPQVVVVGDGQVQGALPATADDTRLIIEGGANIVGAIGNSALVITRGASIEAAGSSNHPVVFSSLDEGFAGAGEWGGLIISGFGVANGCNSGADTCTMEGVSDGTFYYGGSADTTHSSGSLSYVVITEGGHEVQVDTDGDPDPNSNSGDEINGLTLYAVNDTTSIFGVHVNENDDDGIEFFGGDVDVTNLWLTCNGDDSVDWDFGYTGDITNVSVVQANGQDHAFELANNPDDDNALPRSNGGVENATVVLAGGAVDVPFKLKEGTDASFKNVVVSGYAGINCEVPGQIHSVTTTDFNGVLYDCNNATGLLPVSTSQAGFSTPTFWADAPACN